MFKNNNKVALVGTLLVAALAITAATIVPVDNFQAVDGPAQNQPMVCDGSDQVITFPNFVTTHAWLEQIRWDNPGSSYSIAMEFDIGKEVVLSYRC